MYGIALLAYPRAFRRRYAADMMRYFRTRRDVLTKHSPVLGRVRFAVEMATDLFRSIPRQHLARRSFGPASPTEGGRRADRRRGHSIPPAASNVAAGSSRGGRRVFDSGSGRATNAPASPGAGGRGSLLESTGNDLRAALRCFLREPGFALTVVLTLALGIGASAAAYSLVDGVLLEPLPYEQPDRLVYISLRNERLPRLGMSVVDYLAVSERQDGSFESLAALIHSRQANAGGPPLPNRVAVTGGGEPESVSAAWVAGQFFTTLGMELAAGRDFAAGEDQPGADRVVVISNAFAQRTFAAGQEGPGSAGGDPRAGRLGEGAGAADTAVGQHLFIEGVSFTVIGVLPPGIHEVAGVRADVWPQFHLYPPGRRGPFYMRVFGRLAPGATVDGVTAELGRISDEIFPLWAAGFQDRTARMFAMPLEEVIIGDVAPMILIVGGAVALVLLITVANVAGLTLTRAVGRQREIAVRAALGAGTGQLARFVLVESVVLAAAGGLLGAGLAVLGIEAFRRFGPLVPRIDQVGLDAGFFAFAGGVTLLSGVVIGLSPLALVLPRGPGSSLRAAGRGASSSRASQRLRSVLVLAEFALTAPLLIAAALLLTSLLNLQATDPGFDPQGALAVPIGLPEATYPDEASARRFWDEVEVRVGEIPGVVAAGLATGLPPDLPAHFNNFDLLDRPVQGGAAQPQAPWSTVTPGFFEALGIPLREGRTFRAADDENNALVAVVTAGWAERFYPGESAVGKQMITGGCVPCGPTTIVGVVGEVKYRGLAGDGEGVYVPAAQERPRNMYLVVRSERPVEQITPLLHVALQDLDPDLPFEPVTMWERLSASVAGPRQWTALLGGFGITAVVLVAVGIFGLLSYFVDRQRREIGVRMALGADGGRIVQMVVRRGLGLAAAGVLAGLAASLALTRWLESMLYEVSPTDPATWVGVTGLLLAVALAACYLPARRAAGIEPSRALTAD